MEGSIYVVNARGERKPFSFRKVCRSARRVGASSSTAREIAETIEKEVYTGIKTIDIFKKVKRLLAKAAPGSPALRFNLKQGMRKLGPTGFPFEKYIGKIFSSQGFKVKLNQHISGSCVKYEIDFLAQKKDILYVGECKYRNLAGGRVHSKTALANYARFLDIEKGRFFDKKRLKIKSILVTNTKFTKRAVKYSQCVGVELWGWNFPKNKGLEYLIDRQKLYPITILPSFKKSLADVFIKKRIMLVQDILKINIKNFAKETKIPQKFLEAIAKEARTLLQ